MTDSQETTNQTDAGATAPDDREERRAYSKARRMRVILAVVLVILAILLSTIVFFVFKLSEPPGAPSKSTETSGLTWVRSIYGWGKTEAEQLNGPSDVAVGPDGTIWVCDAQRFQVVGFTPNGAYKAVIKQGDQGIFPQSITVSRNNEIYVCDYMHDRIVVFSPGNKVLREWKVQLPMEIAVRGNRVAVGSRWGVALFDTKGAVISVWGSGGKGPEQFDVVRGIAIGADGTIYTSDTQNKRVKAYDQTGKLLWVVPKSATHATGGQKGNEAFQLPTGMTFDGNGDLWVADPFAFQLIKMSPKTGKILGRWGEFGTEDGKFAYPTSLDYDSSRDWFAVADTANNRVQIIRVVGTGGSPFAGIRRALVGPWWVCTFPLILIILAILLVVTSRKRARQAEEETAAAVHEPAESTATAPEPGASEL